jgi:hypothetical protein
MQARKDGSLIEPQRIPDPTLRTMNARHLFYGEFGIDTIIEHQLHR